jgi:hypothetical protein
MSRGGCLGCSYVIVQPNAATANGRIVRRGEQFLTLDPAKDWDALAPLHIPGLLPD